MTVYDSMRSEVRGTDRYWDFAYSYWDFVYSVLTSSGSAGRLPLVRGQRKKRREGMMSQRSDVRCKIRAAYVTHTHTHIHTYRALQVGAQLRKLRDETHNQRGYTACSRVHTLLASVEHIGTGGLAPFLGRFGAVGVGGGVAAGYVYYVHACVFVCVCCRCWVLWVCVCVYVCVWVC
jgi:hypothetical protein